MRSEHVSISTEKVPEKVILLSLYNSLMKKTNIFEWFLIITVITTLIAGTYESYTEKYIPDRSILAHLHHYGYLKKYAVVYEPSKGIWHLMGWAGSGMMIVMMLYSFRKRFTSFKSLGSMRHWLAIHMFLGILGPVLVTFHTTFKFGGIIATSFWCMIVTMVFGILGRYIYVQIPRSISGAELDVKDIEKAIEIFDNELGMYINNSEIPKLMKTITTVGGDGKKIQPLKTLFLMIESDIKNYFRLHKISIQLRTQYNLDRKIRKWIIACLKKKVTSIRRKNFLTTSHRLLHYWHVLHVPLAMVMLLIMFLHIIVYYLFRVSP